ncbi:hypothetical protein [Micromonospora sp. IBHARD004]|uniref:hypothetical protein n=1 Tax=Micromonospora sp. IBHARD004 TaxID=3457764 RepID=UPI004059FAEC
MSAIPAAPHEPAADARGDLDDPIDPRQRDDVTPDQATPEAPAGSTADGTAEATRVRRRLHPVGLALALYVLLRVVGLLILWAFAHRAGADFWELLHTRYDASWYRQIADEGYDHGLVNYRPDGSERIPNLPFFPLYPGLIAAVAALTPLSTAVCALLVSWTAGLVAAWGIYAVGQHFGSPRTGVALVALWAVLPHAVVESMAYTETLFAALVAWTLYALLRRRWLTAGLLCLLAGLTRPTATALVAAVGLTALVAIVRRRDGWRPWAAAALSPLGYLGYLAWIGHRLGRLDGYFQMQKETWRIGFDGGVYTLRTLEQVLTEPSRLAFYMSALVMAVAAVLIVLLALHRYPLPVVVYSLTFWLVTVGTSGYFYAKGRYLVPAFTLLLPVAMALGKARRRTQVTIVALLVLLSGYYGAYLLVIWTASP